MHEIYVKTFVHINVLLLIKRIFVVGVHFGQVLGAARWLNVYIKAYVSLTKKRTVTMLVRWWSMVVVYALYPKIRILLRTICLAKVFEIIMKLKYAVLWWKTVPPFFCFLITPVHSYWKQQGHLAIAIIGFWQFGKMELELRSLPRRFVRGLADGKFGAGVGLLGPIWTITSGINPWIVRPWVVSSRPTLCEDWPTHWFVWIVSGSPISISHSVGELLFLYIFF